MNDNDFKFVFEASLAREERHTKRLVISLIITILLMFVTNLAWLIAWNQYDYESADEITSTMTASQDGEHNSIKGGDINYGEANGNN